MADLYDALPKVELHCHVEGTVRAATVLELARKAGRPLPVEDPAELYRYTSLDTFLAIFWLVQETLVEPADWERIAYESLVDAVPHGRSDWPLNAVVTDREVVIGPPAPGR